MNLVSRLTIALALIATPLAVVHAEALSSAVGKPLQAAANAARSGNIAGATSAIGQARSAAKTDVERRKVAEMAAYVFTRGGQYGRAASELETVGAPASQLAPLYYQARQYDKAITAAKRSGQTTIVGQSLLQSGRYKEAVGVYSQLVKTNPNITNLSNLAGAQSKSGDKAGYLVTSTKIVKLDPSPASWRRLLVDMKGGSLPREAKLALYHLMNATGTLTNGPDVVDFAKLAIVSGQPGVAMAMVAEGAKSGALPAADPMAAKLAKTASERAATTLPTAAQAANPATALAAGNGYLSLGKPAEAAAAFAVARKGPAAAEAQLFQGIAQVKAGQAAAARATFAGVPDGSLKDVANLWSLYASTK
jgi:tetratricopeptide (TPR) repeat protein